MELAKKSILVTGGGGFLGSHLIAELRDRGCTHIEAPRSSACDLRDASAVRGLLERAHPEVIFHLAARVGGIGANESNPGSYFYDNMAMGINVLEEARLARVQKVVMVGTICSYPKFATVPFAEEALWLGYPEETNAPYGVAKKSLFVMAEAYRRQYGLNSVCLLPVNLYGPHDNFDLETSHVIPAIIRKFVDARAAGQRTVSLWGDGSPTREFLYVEDCASALAMAAERYDSSEPVNVGAGFEISIREVASMVAKITGFEGEIRWDTRRPNGQPRRMLDTTRARERFGFAAHTTLEDGLARTVAWYKANASSIAREHSPKPERN
jgi:GDP-L-fucose synthase